MTSFDLQQPSVAYFCEHWAPTPVCSLFLQCSYTITYLCSLPADLRQFDFFICLTELT